MRAVADLDVAPLLNEVIADLNTVPPPSHRLRSIAATARHSSAGRLASRARRNRRPGKRSHAESLDRARRGHRPAGVRRGGPAGPRRRLSKPHRQDRRSAPPGGGVDIVARVLADRLRQAVGPAVRGREPAGRRRQCRLGSVAHAEPDGYTLLAAQPAPLTTNVVMYQKLNFDPAAFEPLAIMTRIPNTLVVRNYAAGQPACRSSSPTRATIPARSISARRASAPRRT